MKPLTEREYDVMQLLCLGYSNKACASYFKCSVKTIEKHRQSIYYKWNVGTPTAMIRVALRSGEFTVTDFLASKIGEEVRHEKPMHLERITAPA